MDKLTIAAVNGYAIQFGLSIVLACDFAVAARSAQFGSATLRMGWQPDEGGHWLLVEHLGVKRALEFLMRKRIVSATRRSHSAWSTRSSMTMTCSAPPWPWRPSWPAALRWRCAC